MDRDQSPPSPQVPPAPTAAERIAALNAARAAGTHRPTAGRRHPAQGARRVVLIASVAAVAGLSGGFALNAAHGTASASAARATTSANATSDDDESRTAATTATTTATAAPAITTSSGS